ncbi:MAG: tetratricopeptide repeat protein [Nitritalea sp.]
MMYKSLSFLWIFALQAFALQAQNYSQREAIASVMVLWEEGELRGAEQLSTTILRDHPYFKEAYLLRASIREQLGNLEGAIGDYVLLLELAPNLPQALYGHAMLRAETGDYVAAISDLERLMELRSLENHLHYLKDTRYAPILGDKAALTEQKAVIYATLAKGYEEQGVYDVALQYYSKAIRYDTKDPQLYFARAELLRHFGHYRLAVEHYTKVLSMNPYHLASLNGMAFVLSLAEQDADNQDPVFFTQMRDALPTFTAPGKEKGRTCLQSGDFETALAYFQAIMAVHEDKEIVLMHTIALEKTGELEAAHAAYMQLLSEDLFPAEVYFGLGNIARKQGHHEEAVAAYGRAIQERPEFPQAYFLQAKSLASLEDSAGACAALHQAAAQNFRPAMRLRDKWCAESSSD